MKPNQIKSVFGLHTISEFKGNAIESNAFEMDIQTIVTHPDYRCESAKDDIGIICTIRSYIAHLIHFSFPIVALLYLLKPIIFSDVVQPVCISSIQNDYDGDAAVVSGWGWTLEGIM